jgi:hypothetical protein
MNNLCVPTQLCHSTCGTCQINNDPSQCSACSSTLSTSLSTPTFTYNTLTPPGACTLPTTNNAQLLMTVNKDTLLGNTSPLKNVTYNTATHSTVGTPLSGLTGLYKLNVIDFSTLSSNTVAFDFTFTEVHQKLIARARVLSECDTGLSQNDTIKMTLSGSPNVVVTQPLVKDTDTVLEGQVVHDTATFTLTIEFGTNPEGCRRVLQDISIYFEKCK